MSLEPSPPSPCRYYVPGWEGVLLDGTRVRTVTADRIPPKFQKVMRALAKINQGTSGWGHTGEWDGSLWVVGQNISGAWNEASSLPGDPYRTGSAQLGISHHSVVVPISDFEEEDNEFGPVSP